MQRTCLPHVTIVAEPGSWRVPYAHEFADRRNATVVSSYDDIEPGGIAIFFGCTRIATPELLARSEHNLVAHESALPAGRGWSPLSWQILEGARHIPVTLFEAAETLDAGPVYFRTSITLEGHELADELRRLQVEAAFELYDRFLDAYPNVQAEPQVGEPSFFPRRGPADSRLDPERSLADQFDLLRICDDDRYPAFFDYRGHRYRIGIRKDHGPPRGGQVERASDDAPSE